MKKLNLEKKSKLNRTEKATIAILVGIISLCAVLVPVGIEAQAERVKEYEAQLKIEQAEKARKAKEAKEEQEASEWIKEQLENAPKKTVVVEVTQFDKENGYYIAKDNETGKLYSLQNWTGQSKHRYDIESIEFYSRNNVSIGDVVQITLQGLYERELSTERVKLN